MHINRFIKQSLVVALMTSVLLSACTTVPLNTSPREQQHKVKSALVDYLYPYGQVPRHDARRIPQLRVPVRVGIAFVPSRHDRAVMTDAFKQKLLRRVRTEFSRIRAIDSIRIIPSSFLRPRGGTRDLDRIARRFDVDLVALVTHNQIRAVQSNALSISYITIVGALILPGNNHHVQTYVDTAVFDIESRQLLFRASGSDRISQQTSAFALEEKDKQAGRLSLVQATDVMIGHLKTELSSFRRRVRAGSDEADVHYRRGYQPERRRSNRRRYRRQESRRGDYNDD